MGSSEPSNRFQRMFKEWDAGRIANETLYGMLSTLGFPAGPAFRDLIETSCHTGHLDYATFIRCLRNDSKDKENSSPRSEIPPGDMHMILKSTMLRAEPVASSVKAPYGTDFTEEQPIHRVRKMVDARDFSARTCRSDLADDCMMPRRKLVYRIQESAPGVREDVSSRKHFTEKHSSRNPLLWGPEPTRIADGAFEYAFNVGSFLAHDPSKLQQTVRPLVKRGPIQTTPSPFATAL